MRYFILAMAILLYPAYTTAPVQAQSQSQLSISIGNRGTSLGFSMSTYPTLTRIPGYPVYYDPRVDQNYFFYDGLYWVYQGDNWYSSPWYNGPWDYVEPNYVPAFVLRVPVRYYRRPPPYFRGWRADAAPRWGEHWGRNWERQHSGWDRWDRRSVPRAAPLPSYQRNYTGNRYPRDLRQQHTIESRSYRYQPREAVSRQIYQQRRTEAQTRSRQQPRTTQQQRNVQQQRTVRQQQNVRQQQDVRRQPTRAQQQRNDRQAQQRTERVRNSRDARNKVRKNDKGRSDTRRKPGDNDTDRNPNP